MIEQIRYFEKRVDYNDGTNCKVSVLQYFDGKEWIDVPTIPDESPVTVEVVKDDIYARPEPVDEASIETAPAEATVEEQPTESVQ